MKIDAKDLIAGRVATVAAKAALLGEHVEIANCSLAVISGERSWVLDEYLRRKHMGTHRKGPYHFTQPDRFMRRLVRGMLPHRQEKGRSAYGRIRCHNGMPEGATGYVSIEAAHVKKLRSTRYVTIKEICKTMGGR